MSTVLFGQTYYLRFDPKLARAGRPYPPLGSLIAAAHVRRAGYDVAFFDAMLARSEKEWSDALDRTRPRLAVLCEDSFNYLSKMCLHRMREAAFTMLGMARKRFVPVAVSGSDASDHPELYLAAGAQAVILGEGEETLREWLDVATGRVSRAWKDVTGLAFLGPEGELVRTAKRPFLRDLDSLPWPAWDLVDVEQYRRLWRRRHGYHSMNAVTTRGCPFHCNWCAKPIYGQRYAVRSPESVADEVAFLKHRYEPDHISFADDIFGLKPGWVSSFAGALHDRGAVIPFTCLCRADLLTEDVVVALRDAGCRTVWLGAESGSQRILDAMEKGITVEEIREAAARLKKAGIEAAFFLQFGYPGETREDIEKTLELVRECRPDDIGISVSYPLPGTRFFDRVQAELGVRRNWQDSDDLAMLYRGPFGTVFYRGLHRAVHKEFRIRKLRERQRRTLRDTAALAFHTVTLPWARHRLDRLALRPHEGLGPLAPSLTRDEARRPGERAI